MVDTAKYKQRLLNKEQELIDLIARLDEEGRNARIAEVEDPIDTVTASEGQAGAFGVSTVEARTLQQVRDALRRIEDGEYGVCIDCDREIAPARLDAVPWTPYCIDDQERHDREANNQGTSDGEPDLGAIA